ncbi:MFS transporter [Arabiibacter massiliensis]|uniref:MFS transporter n=1 Tax=Arabiibacter massiliensis TaxID=1870985 RepID=UPI0009BB54EC|nr:MFS transporter [Arabiibacter massiliensis]
MGEGEPKTTLWTRDFLLITLVNFLLFASWQTLPFVLPVHLQGLGATDAELGWVTAITTVAALLVRPFCGVVLDAFGRKGVFLFGIAFMALASATYAFFPVVGAVLAVRFVHGLAWGITSTSSQTVASDVIPPRRFGEGMGLFALSASLALALAPGFALGLFEGGGIAPVTALTVGALVCAFAVALVLRYRPVPRRAVTFSLRGLFERRSVLPSAIMFCLSACYGALVTFLALHAAARGVEGIGLFFPAYAAAVALSRPLLGKVVDRKGYGFVIVPGLAVLASALALLAVADTLALFMLVAFLFGAGFAACNSTLQAMAVADVPPERRGAANATYLTGFDSGIGAGSLASGLAAAAIGYGGMYACFTLCPLAALVLFVAFARHRKPPSLQEDA